MGIMALQDGMHSRQDTQNDGHTAGMQQMVVLILVINTIDFRSNSDKRPGNSRTVQLARK